MNMYTTKIGRGGPLTALLVIMALAQVAAIVLGVVAWQSIVAHNRPHPELPLVGSALGLAGLVALVGIWLWRRWAVFLFAALAVVGLVSDVWFGVPAVTALIRVALLAALGFCIKQRWALFR
jgi:hypothetical protein